MTEKRIYLDFNASTPLAPEVVEAMRPLLTEHFGNPSTHHWAGAPAKATVEHARAQVAALLGCDPDEIVFTSGGSESNNHALKGVYFANRDRGEHIVTSAVEHPAIIQPLRFLEKLGAKVTLVPVDRNGRVDPDDVRKALTPRTLLVSIMHANNEVKGRHWSSGRLLDGKGRRSTEVAALFSTIIESAKLASVEPKAYLRLATYAALRC